MTSRSSRRLPILAAAAVIALGSCSDDGTGTAGGQAQVATVAASAAATTNRQSNTRSESSTEPTNASQGATGVALEGEQFTPVTMEVFSTPRWFTNSAGEVHVAYEVRLTNAFPFPATVTEVEVRDVASGRAVQTLSGDDLLATMSLQPTGAQPTVELTPAEVGVLWMDIPFGDATQLPAEIEHTVTITLPDDLPLDLPNPMVSTAGRVAVDAQPPTVIGPPLAGPGWVAFGSCCDGPHRRAMQPVNNGLWLAQRYAIDFNRVNESDQLATGDPDLNESWPTYDQPVLAVADATVVQAANDFADQIPNNPTPVSLAQADGNFVILELADGVYAFYAHLKPGSVDVRPGDTVTKGQVIARSGNSGSSTGPHLHFQLMDRDSALLANGVPYVFDSYTVTGQTPPIEEIITGDPREPLAIDTATAGARTNELPVGRDVVEFAAVA